MLDPVASRKAQTLLVSMVYTFVCADGTEYRNAVLLDVDERGYLIQYRGARVFIAAHELADAT